MATDVLGINEDSGVPVGRNFMPPVIESSPSKPCDYTVALLT